MKPSRPTCCSNYPFMHAWFLSSPNKRRLKKNAKYGTGGHRNIKSNSSDSYDDTRQFSMKKNRAPFKGAAAGGNGGGGRGGAGKKTAKGGQRPGKAKRQKSRSMKK
jgi:hypothetical protein